MPAPISGSGEEVPPKCFHSHQPLTLRSQAREGDAVVAQGKTAAHGQQGASRKAGPVLASTSGRWLSNHFALETQEGAFLRPRGMKVIST